MKGIITLFFSASFVIAAHAAEPVLKVEFTGSVTGNTLTCERQHFSCPVSNHFGAPWGEDSMVADPSFNWVKGEIYIAYNRGNVSFTRTNTAQSIDVRVDSHGQTNITSGVIRVGGSPFDLDRDYIDLVGSIREGGYLDVFGMYDRQTWQRAGFSWSNNTISGHSYFGQRNGQKTLLKKFVAETSVSAHLELFDLPRGEWFFETMSRESLPGFEWDGTESNRVNNRASIRLRDFKSEHSEEVGRKFVQYTTTVTFKFRSIKVTSLSRRFPDPDPPMNVPGRPQLEIQ